MLVVRGEWWQDDVSRRCGLNLYKLCFSWLMPRQFIQVMQAPISNDIQEYRASFSMRRASNLPNLSQMIPDVCKHLRAFESNLLSVLVLFVSCGIAPAFTVTRSPAWLNQESKKPSKWSTSGIFMFPCPKLEVLYSHSQNWFKGSILQQKSGKRHIMCMCNIYIYIWGYSH